MNYGYLADAVVGIHLAFVAYVLFGQVAVVIGWACRWGFVRNFWFRGTHLLSIAIVAAESLLQVPCPLTVWEKQLRYLDGKAFDEGATFIGQLLHDWLFYDADPAIFTPIYVGFALLVVLTFIMVPPRLPRRRLVASGPPVQSTVVVDAGAFPFRENGKQDYSGSDTTSSPDVDAKAGISESAS